ncbi:hypothetical protein V6B14_13360 [Sporosarcina psychrophila]
MVKVIQRSKETVMFFSCKGIVIVTNSSANKMLKFNHSIFIDGNKVNARKMPGGTITIHAIKVLI